MDDLVPALLGAIAGAVVTGLIAWVIHRRAHRAERNWETAVKLAELLGGFLSPYTPDSIKSDEDIWQFQEQLGRIARQLHLLGYLVHGTGSPLSILVEDYSDALRRYLAGDLKRGQLEQRRAKARTDAEVLIAEIKNMRPR